MKTGDYEFVYSLPDLNSCKLGNDSVHNSDSNSIHDGEALHLDMNECSRDPYSVFVSNFDFNGTGEYCFGK